MRSPFYIPLLCAALLAAQVQAQVPNQASEPLSPPVEALRTTPLPIPDSDRGGTGAVPDAPSANSDTITETPLKPTTPDQNTQKTKTSEPQEIWPGTAPSGDPRATAVAADAGPDPLDEARRHWRGAVAGGTTDLGFRAWVMAALGGGEAPLPDSPDPPPQAGSNPTENSPAATPPINNADAAAPPTTRPSADSQASRTRDISGRWLQRAGPVALGAAGRVVTTFGAAIPTAFCAPLIVCYIELESGEVLTDTPSWGDTARWQVTVKVQGSDPETIILEIKPSEDAGLTNLVIPTDRRLYTINLVNDGEVHTPILSFIYPDTGARLAAERIAARKAQEAGVAAASAATKQAAAVARRARLAQTGVETSAGLRDPGRLDFGFRVSGKAPFRPVRVYTDGRKTYIDLHPNYRGPLPTVVPGKGEENKALNTRVAEGGKRLVADRVIQDIWLQAGTRKVRIQRTGS